MPRTNSVIPSVPHSWGLAATRKTATATPDTWPPSIYPGCSKRGRYILRQHRYELVACGALTRVGRELVVFGGPYVSWLARQSDRVLGFDIASRIAASSAPST